MGIPPGTSSSIKNYKTAGLLGDGLAVAPTPAFSRRENVWVVTQSKLQVSLATHCWQQLKRAVPGDEET